MLGRRTNRWRKAIAQTAIILLLVQAAFGVSACRELLPTADGGANFAGLLCAVQNDSVPDSRDPSKTTHQQCPACFSLICHVSAILADVAAVPQAPGDRITVVADAHPIPASIGSSGVHNRGPPLARIA